MGPFPFEARTGVEQLGGVTACMSGLTDAREHA
jgi:hypothetical protein